MQPVIFIMVCQNYDKTGFGGFSLSKPAYSAYPAEREVIFSENCLVRLLDIHEKAVLRG